MYVEDLKKDFYEFLCGKRVFLMVHYDIDSICACRILQTLLRNRHVLYSMAVVCGLEDLKTAFRENRGDVKYFVLINCGGTVDIVEILEPEEDIVFFVLDAHRPTDLCNIYSTEQVRLLSSPEDDPDVPAFSDMFRDSDDDVTDDEENGADGGDGDGDSDDENGGGGENRTSKRRRLDEQAILKRRETRLWEERRDRLYFEYSQFTYYAKASAIVMFHLAWKLNKDDKDLCWLAIVGLTEQMLLGKIDDTRYVLETGGLRSHCTLLHNRNNDTETRTALRISYQPDLRLALYRHWTVESSLKYSMFTACRMKLWSLRGDKKLHQLLAEMGLPLVQSRQTFTSMDLQLRQEFHKTLESLSEKYGLEDIVYASFVLQYGYRNKYCASDIVYALLAILEASPMDKKPEERFNAALDCLSRKKEVLDQAIERSKTIVRSLFKTVQTAIDMKQIVTAGPFVYFIIQENCLHWYTFSHHHILFLLAQYVLRAYVSMSRNKKASTIPLIVSTPKSLEGGTCVLLGIPPLCENSPKNFFGKAFEQAAERINCFIKCDSLDTSYVELHTKDRTRFFDALTAVLA